MVQSNHEKIKYYISKRFTEDIYRQFPDPSLSKVRFQEMVTMDHLFCEMIYEDSRSEEFIGIRESLQEINRFPIASDEQVLKCMVVHADVDPFDKDGFSFCGYDIIDGYDSHSWLTNYGIPLDENSFSFTDFGLLASYSEAMKWIRNHMFISEELQNGEYTIYAVWRQTNR